MFPFKPSGGSSRFPEIGSVKAPAAVVGTPAAGICVVINWNSSIDGEAGVVTTAGATDDYGWFGLTTVATAASGDVSEIIYQGLVLKADVPTGASAGDYLVVGAAGALLADSNVGPVVAQCLEAADGNDQADIVFSGITKFGTNPA